VRLAEEALAAVAELADRVGVAVAIQPGAGELAAAAELLSRLDCRRLGLALDSAATTDIAALRESAGASLGAVQLRDVRRVGGELEEVEFGRGDVDFANLLGTLSELGYSGSLAVRRDAAVLPVDAMRQGRDYVRSLMTGRQGV
jgi:sugar phosphate isomerase/epimerase